MPRSSGPWLLFGAVAALGCRAPTQVTLEISTEAECAAIEQHHVDVKVGATGSLGEGSTTSTNKCDAAQEPHRIGSLVVVPRDANDAEFGVMVVAGVTRDVATCEQFHFDGCIVARRTARFIPHTPQTLPIVLTLDCLGIPCGPGETCVNRACVPAGFTPAPPCAGPEGCGGAGGAGTATSTSTTSTGNTTSTGMGGAGGGGGAGAGGAGGAGPVGAVIPCGNQMCQPGEICCNTDGLLFDECDGPGGCNFPLIEISCAGPADCMNQSCCAQWESITNRWLYAECKASCGPTEIPFCGDPAGACPEGWTCISDGDLGNGYGWCSQ